MEQYQYLLAYIIMFATPSILLILLKNHFKSQKSLPNLPPCPPKLPLIGNLHQIGTLPHLSLQNLSNKYGPLMFLQLGTIQTLVISSADVAREIFKSHDLIFSGRPPLYAAKKFSYGFVDISFAPYGQYWRQVRKICVLKLLSVKRVKSFVKVMEEEVALMVDSIASSCASNQPVNVSRLALSLANSTVCRVAFGKKSSNYGEEEEVVVEEGGGKKKMKFHEILYGTQSLLGEFNFSDYFPWLSWVNRLNGVDLRIEKNFDELDRFYDEVIEEHLLRSSRDNSDGIDVVDVLLQVQKDPNQDITLTNKHIKGVLTDVFVAGSDTSSATIEWTMTELIKNPLIMKKLQDEIRQVIKAGNSKVEETDLPNLKYLKLVLKESFRLHPPAPLLVPRETTEECIIMGYEIPSKTRVFVNAKAIGVDPKCWDEPLKFKPERFLNNSIDFRGQDFELIPFGIGRRSCPGLNFAMTLIELALANLLYCFEWKLPQGLSIDEVDVLEAPGITIHKKVPLVLLAAPSGQPC